MITLICLGLLQEKESKKSSDLVGVGSREKAQDYTGADSRTRACECGHNFASKEHGDVSDVG